VTASYEAFLKAKVAVAAQTGLDCAPDEVNPMLKPHQRATVVWNVRGGQRADFHAFGLGKSVIQIETMRIILAKIGMDPNTCASRLSSLQYKGVAVSRWRSGVRKKEWAQRSEPVAPRMKVPAPKFRVAAVEPVLIGSMERVIIEAPAGTFQPGMELRQA
jgi:hypothetical protein